MKLKKVSLIVAGIAMSLTCITSCFDGGGGGGETPGESYKWLIMYYCDGDNNLEEDLMNDLNEMESVNIAGKNLTIIALVDRNASYSTVDGDWNDTRVYQIEYDPAGYNTTLVSKRVAVPELGITTDSTTTELNMGDGATLTKFIQFCVSSYPDYKKMLLLSNHGGGWRDTPEAKKKRLEKIGITKGVCWDETDADDYLSTSELRTAASSALGTGNKLDIIAFDACLMAMVEVAYELKDVANYMVASQETIPGFGFPYTQILTAYTDTYTSVQFGRNIVDQYCNAYINGTNVEYNTFTDDSVTLSLTDLSRIDALAVAINDLGTALDAHYSNTLNIDMRLQSESFADIDYVDIRDYCAKETQCLAERNAVTAAFDAAVIYSRAGSGNSGARGLSIYMPLKWLDRGEQPDYTSTNIQFAGTASSWRTYLTSITDPTATDQNEILEYENGGGIYVTVPSTLTGYIYYNGDEDAYGVNSDGSFSLEYNGLASVIVDVYIIDQSTSQTVNNPWMSTPGSLNITYNPSTEIVIIYVYGGVNTTNSYTLTFTNI